MFDNKLAHALNFTEADLAANRQGKMTTEQQTRLRSIAMRKTVYQPLLALALFTLVALALIAFSVNSANISAANGAVTSLIIVPPFVLFALGYALYSWRNLRADLSKGEVAMEAGRIALKAGTRTDHRLQVQMSSFYISEAALTTFINDARYRIYYAPRTQRILSAEPMRDDE